MDFVADSSSSKVSSDSPNTVAAVSASSSSEDSTSTMSLKDITDELEALMASANSGLAFDERRLDYLIASQNDHPEYQAMLLEAKMKWKEEIDPFLRSSLNTTRSFVPPNIFTSSEQSLVELGLTPQVAKRVFEKKPLWLTRMSELEISRLHDVDLVTRYNATTVGLDIIEIAAIYYCMPESFLNDLSGKKSAYKETLESMLKRMLSDREKERLPKGSQRAQVYSTMSETGPVTDLDSVRAYEIPASGRRSQRKSFIDVCAEHSIIGKLKARNRQSMPIMREDSTDSLGEGES